MSHHHDGTRSNHRPNTITLNVSTQQSPTGNFLGWNVLQNNTIVPAQNVTITDYQRIAVFINGGNGEVIQIP